MEKAALDVRKVGGQGGRMGRGGVWCKRDGRGGVHGSWVWSAAKFIWLYDP